MRGFRYEAVRLLACSLAQCGYNVFSPIVYWRTVFGANFPGDFEYFKSLDYDMIARCDGLLVYKLEGWEKSVGVTAEIAKALELGKPVRGIESATLLYAAPNFESLPLLRRWCLAGKDGECNDPACPQHTDHEPDETNRPCPLPHFTDDDE